MRLLIVGFFVLLASCAATMDGLTAAGQVYAVQSELAQVYGPSIRNYEAQDFCDPGANPPVVMECADAKVVISLNRGVQETGNGVLAAQSIIREVNAACTIPDSQLCTDQTKLLALSVQALRLALGRLSSSYIAAGLNK